MIVVIMMRVVGRRRSRLALSFCVDNAMQSERPTKGGGGASFSGRRATFVGRALFRDTHAFFPKGQNVGRSERRQKGECFGQRRPKRGKVQKSDQTTKKSRLLESSLVNGGGPFERRRPSSRRLVVRFFFWSTPLINNCEHL